MKTRIVIVFSFLLGLLTGCKDDSSLAGGAVLDPVNDKILVREDTFPLLTMIDTCDYIISAPDSFLLGENQTNFGTIKADILAQLACPEYYSYPKGTVFDSIRIYLYYNSWTGSDLSPLSVTIYEMDREPLEYSPFNKYRTNESLDRFCSREDSTLILEQERIVIADRYKDSAYSSVLDAYMPAISFKVDPNSPFFKRFTAFTSYGSQEDFTQNIFRGLYITTNFGSSTALYVSAISMVVDYHFTYQRYDGQDVTETGQKGFYANSEVKQINRYVYEDRSFLLDELKKDSLYNYVVAPAGIYTYVDLPMRAMYDTIFRLTDTTDMTFALRQYDTYAAYVNLARLKVMVNDSVFWVNGDRRNTTFASAASQMLLIRCGKDNERLHTFFDNKELPADTVAILSSLQSGVNKDGNTVYYYSFDISTLLTNILHTGPNGLPEGEPTLRMALVPVTAVSSTNASTGSSYVVSIKESQTVSATRLYSTKNPAAQTTLQVVSSLFHKDF